MEVPPWCDSANDRMTRRIVTESWIELPSMELYVFQTILGRIQADECPAHGLIITSLQLSVSIITVCYSNIEHCNNIHFVLHVKVHYTIFTSCIMCTFSNW